MLVDLGTLRTAAASFSWCYFETRWVT